MENQEIVLRFHETEILGTYINGVPHVAVRPICVAIGLNTEAALRSLKNDEILADDLTEWSHRDATNKANSMYLLPIRRINAWLFSIQIKNVKPEAREKLLLYKKECADVLYDHFFGDKKPIDMINTERAETLLNLGSVKLDIEKLKKRQKMYQKRLVQLDSELSFQIREQRLKAAGLPHSLPK